MITTFQPNPCNDRNDESGFTLIELMVVILIIGVLTAIAVPVFLNQREAAVDAATRSDVRNIGMAASEMAWEADVPITKAAVIASGMATVADDTEWSVAPGADGGACVWAWNDDGGKFVSEATAETYDSEAGGVGKDGGACPLS